MEGLLKKAMPQAMGAGQAPQPMASRAAVQGNMADGNGMENVSAEEQADYDRGMTAAMQVLHGDEGSQRAVVESLDPNNVVGSVAQAAVGIVVTVDEQIDLNEAVLMPMLEELVDLVAEAGVEAKRIKVTPKQAEQALATAVEMLMDEYGVDEESYQQVAATTSPDEAGQTYVNTMNEEAA